MSERFDEGRLRSQLNELDPARRMTFALSCAERLLPNYRRFALENNWGNEDALRQALDFGWTCLLMGVADASVAASLQDACAEEAPDTEAFESLLVSAALDAANSAANVAALPVTPSVELVVEIATFARDSVDLYTQEIEGMPSVASDLEERIRMHPLMQAELSAQRDALAAIVAGISPETARERWRAPPRGNLGI